MERPTPGPSGSVSQLRLPQTSPFSGRSLLRETVGTQGPFVTTRTVFGSKRGLLTVGTQGPFVTARTVFGSKRGVLRRIFC